MQVGEILLRHGWVEWEPLALALTDQADLAERAGPRGTRIRLCSLLVSRGAVDFDHAARALGEHFGCAAVLRRHLERRDRHLPSLLRTELARKLVALPIGRMASGALVVCVRDPSPALHAALVRALKQEVVIAVAPASYVERLVARAYADVEVPIEVGEPVIEPANDFDIELDDSADDDLAIDIEEAPEPAAPAPRHRPLPVEIKPVARPATEPPARDSLDALIASFPDIDDREWLFDAVMGYVAKRWTAAVLLAIGERRATGLRGHGRRLKPHTTRTLGLPLAESSLVQLARDERRVADDWIAEPGRGYVELLAALEDPAHPVAAPIRAGDAIAYVLVVGDPLEDGDSVADLEVLAEAMSDVLERI